MRAILLFSWDVWFDRGIQSNSHNCFRFGWNSGEKELCEARTEEMACVLSVFHSPNVGHAFHVALHSTFNTQQSVSEQRAKPNRWRIPFFINKLLRSQGEGLYKGIAKRGLEVAHHPFTQYLNGGPGSGTLDVHQSRACIIKCAHFYSAQWCSEHRTHTRHMLIACVLHFCHFTFAATDIPGCQVARSLPRSHAFRHRNTRIFALLLWCWIIANYYEFISLFPLSHVA